METPLTDPMGTPARQRLTPVQWLICVMAAIGFAFDIYAILTLPLIARPALSDLASVSPGTPEFNRWVGYLFWIPAMAGGAFGLLGGYLTDWFGRRRVLVVSILVYAFSAVAAGYSRTAVELLVFRTTTFIGVCVEFVAAVAWLAELFPDAKRREAVLGYTQAFSSVGGLLVAGANYLAVALHESLPAIQGSHAPWRYTLISGVIPAIPLMVIRPFLPESPAWQQKKLQGTLKRPSLRELFQPGLRRTTLITALLFACSYGAAFGALQQAPGIIPGLQEVKALPPLQKQATVPHVQLYQELGGLAGRFLLAVLAVRIVSRRLLLRIFQIPGLLVVPLVFYLAADGHLRHFEWGILLAGVITVGQLSFWGNYLPRVYPTHLRGTGESFAANVGGRMVGTSAAFLATSLQGIMPGPTDPARLAYAAATVAFLVYAIGLVASFWLPEPEQEALPE